MSRLKRILLTTAAALGLLVPMAAPALVSAAVEEPKINNNLNCGANLDFSGDSCNTDTNDAGSNVGDLITRVINIISLVVGAVAVIMIIVGGLRYITSGGESGGVTSAKNTIMYAIVGLVVVALAQVIVKFVVNRATPATE